jgi:hypothetical protein
MLPGQWGLGSRGDVMAGTGGHGQDTGHPNEDRRSLLVGSSVLGR